MPITFEELIARREKRESARKETCEIEIPGTDQTLLICRPSESKLLEFYGAFQSASDVADILPVIDSALYHCCPALQDKKLHETIGIKDPLDIVPALFDIPTRDRIGGDLFRFLGILPQKSDNDARPEAEEHIKN